MVEGWSVLPVLGGVLRRRAPAMDATIEPRPTRMTPAPPHLASPPRPSPLPLSPPHPRRHRFSHPSVGMLVVLAVLAAAGTSPPPEQQEPPAETPADIGDIPTKFPTSPVLANLPQPPPNRPPNLNPTSTQPPALSTMHRPCGVRRGCSRHAVCGGGGGLASFPCRVVFVYKLHGHRCQQRGRHDGPDAGHCRPADRGAQPARSPRR